MHGAALSLDWALAAAGRLAAGGRLLLYTGSAIVGGEDRLEAALRARLPALGCTLRYAELDPDIFGEQLDEPGYEDVERIAAVGAVIVRAARLTAQRISPAAGAQSRSHSAYHSLGRRTQRRAKA